MTTIYSLQNEFQSYLLDGQEDIAHSIIGTTKVPVTTRLNIYRDAYQARLLEALSSNYPGLYSYLGEEAFHALGINYIDNYPSSYRSIRWFGDKLPAFLTQSDMAEHLAEFAEFEWAMTLAFDATDHAPFTLEAMASIAPETWEHMILSAHPSLQRMNFFWNVVDIWQNVVHEEELTAPIKDLNPQPWVLWRHDYQNRFYPLANDEAWAMDSMMKGATFGELCEGLCAFVDEQEIGMRAATFLKNWIHSGLIATIKF